MKQAVFLICSQDRKGLLSGISTFFYQQNFNILHCQQYTDNRQNLYFMRVCMDITEMPITWHQLEEMFSEFAAPLKLQYSIHYSDEPQRIAIMVSRTSHCLYDLLMHAQDEKDLPCEIPLIISNHPQLEEVAARFKVP